jgi:beta-glucuronidase
MKRQFDDHIIRSVTCLDGAWSFRIDPENIGVQEGWTTHLPTTEKTTVPSVWNTTMGLLEYEGAAWYEKKFYTKGGTLRFVFEAVLTQADVWLDGEKLGEHYGGFCQFELIANEVAAGMHTLTVRVDNTFDDQSIPIAHTDWWHYGGITRSVTVEELHGLCTMYNHFNYVLSDDLTCATAHFTAEIYNAENATVTAPVSFVFDGETVCVEELTLAPYETKTVITPDFSIENVRLWDPNMPNLYDIAVITDTDDLMDRTGLRSIEVKGMQLLLNGKPFEVRGVNRHEENTDFGFAFPVALMKRDIDIIRNMNANAIRGSHYPNARVFVDMLDECGMTFWSEIPMWGNGYTQEMLADPILIRRAMEMHREMVRAYYNHPSIIIWGMFNENPSQFPEVRTLAEQIYPYLKENGGNRLVTYACNRYDTCLCLDLCDVICINNYVGWYGAKRSAWQENTLSKLRQHMENMNIAPKPIIMSEFGAAAIYGHHTFDDLKWTEEYQATLLTEALQIFRDDPWIVGYYIWQFCDIRTCSQNGLNRARHYNNKGILNEYRRPKQAYFAVRDLYKKFKEENENE